MNEEELKPIVCGYSIRSCGTCTDNNREICKLEIDRINYWHTSEIDKKLEGLEDVLRNALAGKIFECKDVRNLSHIEFQEGFERYIRAIADAIRRHMKGE